MHIIDNFEISIAELIVHLLNKGLELLLAPGGNFEDIVLDVES
jgi:hypothetical protein